MSLPSTQEISQKSGLTAFILCFFLGSFGIHRFYVGKIGTGILMLLTMGGLGFWTLYDIFSIACKNFTDSDGRSVEIQKSPHAPRNILLVVAVVFTLFFGLLFAIFSTMMSGLKDVSQKELAALRHDNIDQAYTYTSSEFQKAVPLDTFKSFVQKYPQLTTNVDSTTTHINVDNNNGSVAGYLTMKNGSSVTYEMTLINEQGQWKIYDLHLTHLPLK